MFGTLLLILLGVFTMIACVGAIVLNYEKDVENYKRTNK